MDLSYKEDLRIDRYYLDEICDTHAEKYAKWAELYVNAVKNLNDEKTKFEKRKSEAKDNINRIKSQLNLDVRRNYKKYELEKITDSIADSWINTQEEYLAALENLRNTIAEGQQEIDELDYKVDILKVAKDSFDHRKQMIQAEVSLYVAGYWAKPSQPKEFIRDKLNEASEEVGESAANSMIRRRRKLLDNVESE